MIRHTGEADRAQEKSVMIAQSRQAIFRHHAAGMFVRFAVPVEIPVIEADVKLRANSIEHSRTFRYDFLADSIARHNSNLVGFHCSTRRRSRSYLLRHVEEVTSGVCGNKRRTNKAASASFLR